MLEAGRNQSSLTLYTDVVAERETERQRRGIREDIADKRKCWTVRTAFCSEKYKIPTVLVTK